MAKPGRSSGSGSRPHNTTHLDAPWHFASTMDGGKRAITIDEVPLEWCLQPAVKLDFRHFPDGYVATARDVAAELERIGHTLARSEEHTSELQSLRHLVCRLLLEKKKTM